MKKLLILVAILMLVATSASAWVITESSGPENITVCYAKGTAEMVSGNVVVLQTSSPTYPGAEVTGSVVAGSTIYGVVVDKETYTPSQMVGGRWFKVQTYGYVPIIKTITSTAGAGRAFAIGDGLGTSLIAFKASNNGGTGGPVTGGCVAYEAETINQASGIVPGFLQGV